MHKLVFKTPVQAILFEHELKGQLSDGHWENSRPHNHWEAPCRAVVSWSATGPWGREWYYQDRKYNFANKDLLDVVGMRMVRLARVVLGVSYEVAEEASAMDAFNLDGSLEGRPPTWFDSRRREQFATLPLESIQKALEDESLYSMRDLRRDLKEMKNIFESQLRVA